MSDPERRVDDFEQTLLASAKDDGLRPDRKAAMALALGIGAGATVAGVASVAKAAGAAGAATKAKVAASAIVMKWLAVAAVGGAVVASATVLRRASEPATVELGTAAPPSAIALARVAPHPAGVAAAAAPAESAAAIESPAPIETAPLIARPVIARSVVATGAANPAAAPASPTLADEQRTIERARAALAEGDVVAARRALDEHDATFANGAFAAESELLRIDARARAGDHEGAARAAREALARSPASPYAARLRALAAEAPVVP